MSFTAEEQALIEKAFELLKNENAASKIVRDQWLTPYDAYSQFIATVKTKFGKDEALAKYLKEVYNTDSIDDALTPKVMFELALTNC